MDPAAAPPRHARSPRSMPGGLVAALAVVAALVIGSTATVTAALTGQPLVGVTEAQTTPEPAPTASAPIAQLSAPLPAPVEAVPVPTVEAEPAALPLCSTPAFTDALAAGDDAGAIAAAGGGETFRSAVAGGAAPCVALDDPARVWAVINKARPNAPLDYRPADVTMPDGVRSIEGGALRADAAASLSAMVRAAGAAGVGEIALQSGFRSYETQQTSYANQVAAQGPEQADLASARPGFSEHQSGLAGDVVACADVCGTLDDLAATAQGAWIAEHAWEYGWITRYEDGFTPITGYSPEPWHLRYIGPELARAYHEGGWGTLEEFFGLPAAPAYLP
jgi:zinc D-Ala-D-Ala carboxypeptidase